MRGAPTTIGLRGFALAVTGKMERRAANSSELRRRLGESTEKK